MMRIGGSNRWRAAFVVGLVGVLSASSVMGGGHGAVSDEMVSVAVALIARAFPGAQLDYTSNVLVWPDGRRERLALSGGGVVNVGAEMVAVAGLEFPDRRESVRVKLDTSGHVPNGSAVCRIVVLRATGVTPGAAPTVVGYREVQPDLASPLTTCGEIGLDQPSGSVPSASRWPRVIVEYSSFHEHAREPVAIAWQAVVDFETLTGLSRIPVAVTRVRRGTWEDILARPDGPADVLFTSESTGVSVRVHCQLTSCRVTPDIVRQILR